MSIILNIDTAQENAFVCISENGIPLLSIRNEVQKDHATFLHEAIRKLSEHLSIPLTALSAISIAMGPGSYTGLRVGMSSAKGLCYALNKPLIGIGTLEIMANDISKRITNKEGFFCPMIDARRMEVFTAIYDHQLKEVLPPTAMILDEFSFSSFLKTNPVYFSGSGSDKLQSLLTSQNAQFLSADSLPNSMSMLSDKRFKDADFSRLNIVEPFYIKDYKAF